MNKVDNVLTTIRTVLVKVIMVVTIMIFLPITIFLVMVEILEEYLSKPNVNMIGFLLFVPLTIAQFYWLRTFVDIVFILLGVE